MDITSNRLTILETGIDISPIFTVAMKAEGFPCWPQTILIFHFRLQSPQHTIEKSRSRYPTDYGNSRSSPFSFSSRQNLATPSDLPEQLRGFCCSQMKLNKLLQSHHPPPRRIPTHSGCSKDILAHQVPPACDLSEIISWTNPPWAASCVSPPSPAAQLQINFAAFLNLSPFWNGHQGPNVTECPLKGTLTTLGTADPEHRGWKHKGRTNPSYNILEKREKIKETEMWQHWNFPKHKEVKIRSVMRTEALEIIHLQGER